MDDDTKSLIRDVKFLLIAGWSSFVVAMIGIVLTSLWLWILFVRWAAGADGLS